MLILVAATQGLMSDVGVIIVPVSQMRETEAQIACGNISDDENAYYLLGVAVSTLCTHSLAELS